MILAGISYDHGWPLWLTLTALGVMAGTVLITITDLSTERP